MSKSKAQRLGEHILANHEPGDKQQVDTLIQEIQNKENEDLQEIVAKKNGEIPKKTSLIKYIYNINKLDVPIAVENSMIYVQETQKKTPEIHPDAENLVEKAQLYIKHQQENILQQIEEEKKDIANVILDVNHIHEWETDTGDEFDLTTYVLEQPDEARKVFNEALNEFLQDNQTGQQAYTHFKNATGHYIPDSDRSAYIVRELTPDDLGKLRLIRATITTVDKPQPKIVWAAMHCAPCGNTIYTKTRKNRLRKPPRCPECNNTKKWTLLEDKSVMMEYQTMEIQDPLDAISTSTTQKMQGRVLGRKYIAEVGREVHLTGILKQEGKYRKKESGVQEYYFQVESVEEVEEETRITEKDEKMIQAFAAEEHPLEELGKMVAPSISVHPAIKEAIILQMAAGENTISDTGTIRGHPHILLVGDPGTAKSRLMKFVKKTIPKSDIASGDKSSSAGLNATVEQKKGGEWTLKAGRIVKCSGGILCIDELDECGEDTQNSLKEAMEYMTVTISKAVNASLKANTRVFACANPVEERFTEYDRISEQIGLPPALLSRFDLVFTIRDKVDQDRDLEIADKILKVYNGDYADTDTHKFIRKYVQYTHAHEPEITACGQAEMKKYYVNLRKAGKHVNTRVIESLIRLSKAAAKIRLSNTVAKTDVSDAIRIYNASLEHAKEDGEIDFHKIYGAASKTEKLMKEIDSTLKLNQPYEIEKLHKVFDESERDIEEALKKLKKKGNIMQPNEETVIKIE